MYTLENFYADDPGFVKSMKNMLKNYHKYVPIVLRGESGTGKTHLMKAFEKYLHETYGLTNSIYITTEEFTNGFVDAITKKKITEFKLKYKNLDALFIDDFEHLRSKFGAQDELFNIFSELINRNAFICVAITTPCDFNINFSKKLITKVLNGVQIDVPIPGFEAKRQKLTEVFAQFNCFINGDLIDYLTGLGLNLNELIGLSKKIIVMKELEGKGCVNIPPEEIKKLLS